jgi:hypothetical protein
VLNAKDRPRMKNLWITILYVFVKTAYSQPNCGAPMPFVQDSDMVFVYGKLKVFPPDSMERMKYLSACIHTASSSVISVSVQENGDFWFQIRKNIRDTLMIEINGKPFSRDGTYYPVEINDVCLDSDSLYLGVVPAVPDPFGYYTEWGTTTKKVFGRKVHFWTKTIMSMDKRYKQEDELSIIYNSFCHDCDSIFITETISKSEDKSHFVSAETRKLIIDHQEILSMSEYFIFNYPHYDSLARGFINFQKMMPDSLYSDRFNKAVVNYSFPEDYHDPDTTTLYTDGQLIGYDEDSIPTFIYPNYPKLPQGMDIWFRKRVLDAISLSDDELKRVNNELFFIVEVDRIGKITELKLLSLVDSGTRQKLAPVLDSLHFRLIPPKSRGRSNGFWAAFYIDLANNSTKNNN